MNPESFDRRVEQICEADDRYEPDAYYFVREALDHTVQALGPDAGGTRRHITGRELALGFRTHALAEFGPLAHLVLGEWRLRDTADIGELVYNLIGAGVLSKQPRDSKDDFKDVYDFESSFKTPFEPRTPAGASDPTGRPGGAR